MTTTTSIHCANYLSDAKSPYSRIMDGNQHRDPMGLLGGWSIKIYLILL